MKKLLFVLLLSLFLVACGNESDSNAESKETEETNEVEETTNEEKEQEEEIEETTEEVEDKTDEVSEDSDLPTGDWEESEFGQVKFLGAGYNDEIGIDGTDGDIKPVELGPINLLIENVTVLDIRPNEEYKDYLFEGRDELRAIVATVNAENTSEDDLEFYIYDTILTTDTGQQLESNWDLTTGIDGEFYGQVNKDGEVWWTLDDTEQDISSVQMIISPPYDMDNYEDLSEEERLEFEILDLDESLEKDGIK